MTHRLDPVSVVEQLRRRDFSVLITKMDEPNARVIAQALCAEKDLYEPLLLGTTNNPAEWYDWNLGFIVSHLDPHWVSDVLVHNPKALAKSEGIAWGLGEGGSDDERIIDFLFYVCEQCFEYDAWWCAAEALDKLGAGDATDIKKRTLRGDHWNNLEYALARLDERAAVIAALRLARAENIESLILPSCRVALASDNWKEIRNAVWLLERLRVDDHETIDALLKLYEKSEDDSHTLRPRIVEALGQIAAPRTRILLESAVASAYYYRTRAYAAAGLGRICDARSVPVLRRALAEEQDERVLSFITQAIYAIEHPQTRAIVQRASKWPENGMIVDESNDWYAHPDVYDRFSDAEDPLCISLDLALSYVPESARIVADLGAGTGRLATFAAERRPAFDIVYAVERNDAMFEFLQKKIAMNPRWQRVQPQHGDISQLPFGSGTIDALISAWAFPSNMWNSATCLAQVREAERVLSDDGVLMTLGWDESFHDELSELWYRFVPEPDFRREGIEEWRRRRRERIQSPRNSHLTFVKRNIRVPLLFPKPDESARVLGHLFGASAGDWVARQQRCEFSINVGITLDDRASLKRAIAALEAEQEGAVSGSP